MPRTQKQITLSKKQIARIKEALRLYDRKREQVVVSETTVTRRQISETDRFNRYIRRYVTPLEDQEDRSRTWSIWSRKRKDGSYLMPKPIERIAQSLNMKKGYDPASAYGYFIIYYAYTEKTDIDIIERQFIVVDKSDGELYRRVERKVK